MLFDYILKENIVVELESSEKDILFAEMTENLVRTNPFLDRNEIIHNLEEREEKMNTCVMKCIAVPHADCKSVKEPLVCLGISRSGIDYEVCSPGSEKYNESMVHLVVMILFGNGDANLHLKVLSDVARLLRIPGFYEAVMFSAKSPSDILNIIREYETEY